MLKLLVLYGSLIAACGLVAGIPALAQTVDRHPAVRAAPAGNATLDEKKVWFRNTIDDLLTGSGPLTTQGRSESQSQQRK